MATELLVTTTSFPEPMKGQNHRSGNNFAIPYLPKGTNSFTFKVVPTGTDRPDSIRFNVYSDNPMGKDHIIWGGENVESEVYNGYKTSQNIKTYEDSLYIGDPIGATSSFNVEIWANY